MYFDQSASYPINKKVLKETFKDLEKFYNSNSRHKKGLESQKIINDSKNTFKQFFNIENACIDFTSGASESNNMILLGLGQNHAKGTIIISPFEHSSVLKPISYLQHMGHRVKIAPVDKEGIIIIDELIKLVSEDTFLISIAACESEIGIMQDINKISKAVKNIKPEILFHSDITQAINKYKLPLDFIDFASFSGHKFGSLKGIGGIINTSNIKLSPIMYGSDLKPGTKPVELIYNMTLALKAIDYKDELDIKALNLYLRKRLEHWNLIKINTPMHASPYILNLSVLNHASKVSQALLNQENIYVSTQSACARTSHSQSILNLTCSMKRAESSIRISLSSSHTLEEINLLLINLERLCRV